MTSWSFRGMSHVINNSFDSKALSAKISFLLSTIQCYIYILLDDPIAKITGGERQEYSNNQRIIMDGSDSVDMSVHPKRNQSLMYSWSCSSSSNDADEYCKNLNENGSYNAITHPFISFPHFHDNRDHSSDKT